MSGFLKLIPILLVIVVLFSLLQLYTAVVYTIRGSYPFAALYAVLSIAGLAIARGLWVQKRNIQSRKG
jgi:hypothetical protein